MVSRNVDAVVSSAAEERRQRIDAFKAKISALRATSKAYHFDSDASIDTLDSLTTCGSAYVAGAAATITLAALPESPNSEKRDNSEEVRKNPTSEVASRANPFLDEGSEEEEESIIVNEIEEIVDPLAKVHKPASALLAKKKEVALNKDECPRIDEKDINAFKEKVATIRAMRKEYHFRTDISLNTLDSVSTGVSSKDNKVQLRIRNMLDRSRDVLAASDQSSAASEEIDSLEDACKNPFVDSEDESSMGLAASTPFVDSEDESSADELPAATNPSLDSDNKKSSPTPPKPATNLLMKKVETLNKVTDHSKKSKPVEHEQEERKTISGSCINFAKQSAASSSSYSGSSFTGFSIDTIDELEVDVNDQPMSEKDDESAKEDEPVKLNNPVAQLLVIRQANKAAAAAVEKHNESVGSINLVSSSSDESLSEGNDTEEQEVNKVVDGDDDDSFEGAVFNEIQKTLFQIESVSYETDTEENVEEEKLAFSDDVKDQALAPSTVKVSLLRDWNGSSNKDETVVKPSATSPESAEMADEEKSATDDSDTTQTCSNSNKLDYFATKDRETTLTPPKKDVVLSDGSISTKNSIFGKVINVANHDLVAERIYYESLRAQYHAELKVHVADEEIRLALDARLKAIQDFYKKKSTVAQIQECYSEDYLAKVASIPRVKPTVIREINNATDKPSLPRVKPTVIREINDATDKPSLPQSPSFSPRQETHKFAFERAHHGIDEAIKAAHEQIEVVPKEEFPPLEESTSQVPETIFTNESFWNEGVEQPPTEEELELSDESLYKKHSKTVVNAWYFYGDVNNLLFESRLYDYEFRRLQKDPLYPYLNSLVGIADSGDDGCTNEDKRIRQQKKREYAEMSPIRICHRLAEGAEAAMPKLKEICIDIGTKLSMKTFAVGPTKQASEALAKCKKKYGGDPLLVTDYCRVAMFTKDIATLLAVMEILLTKYKDKVRRIKLSNLRSDHVPLAGGYRDCKVNIDVDGHICEIQLHLEQMWNIKEGKGYAHYKECKANDVDCTTTYDIKKTLSGLDRKFLSKLIMVGEDATRKVHLEDLHSGNEESIREYFALACIYLKKGRLDAAEKVLSRLVKVRSDSLIFGPRHDETLLFMRKLHESLKRQHKFKDASLIEARIEKAERLKKGDYEPTLSEMCLHDQCGAWEHICDVLLDPSSLDKENIERQNEAVEESRSLWLSLRKTYWSLDQSATM